MRAGGTGYESCSRAWHSLRDRNSACRRASTRQRPRQACARHARIRRFRDRETRGSESGSGQRSELRERGWWELRWITCRWGAGWRDRVRVRESGRATSRRKRTWCGLPMAMWSAEPASSQVQSSDTIRESGARAGEGKGALAGGRLTADQDAGAVRGHACRRAARPRSAASAACRPWLRGRTSAAARDLPRWPRRGGNSPRE